MAAKEGWATQGNKPGYFSPKKKKKKKKKRNEKRFGVQISLKWESM